MWPGTLPCLSALGPPALPRRRGVIWPAWSISYSPSLGYELLWPCPHSSFQCYDSRHVWVIYTELVWELFATSPPLFFFLCFVFWDGCCGKGILGAWVTSFLRFSCTVSGEAGEVGETVSCTVLLTHILSPAGCTRLRVLSSPAKGCGLVFFQLPGWFLGRFVFKWRWKPSLLYNTCHFLGTLRSILEC